MQSLVDAARELFNIRLSSRQVAALGVYESELLNWNRRFNLTAIRDLETVRVKHFLDSFSCVLAWKDRPPDRLVDIGTGAGFPGIPIKILYPAMQLTLVESVGKKVAFCRHVVSQLALSNVQVLHGRAEDAGRETGQREQFDWAVGRAVASLAILAEYALPFVRLGGVLLAQKGAGAAAEVQSAGNALRLLGGQVRQLIDVALPGVADERCLVLIDKVAATPPAYPRRAGMPVKKPL